MITLIGLMFLALACLGAASSALDPDERKDSCTLDALLFLLCLVSVLGARARKRADPDDEG